MCRKNNQRVVPVVGDTVIARITKACDALCYDLCLFYAKLNGPHLSIPFLWCR